MAFYDGNRKIHINRMSIAKNYIDTNSRSE